MNDDLVQFLRARLDEDEQTAFKAGSAPWRYNPHVRWRHPDTGEFEAVVSAGPSGQAIRIAITGEHGNPLCNGRAGHIARHDPARALAEVEAKRRVLALNDQATADARSADYLVAGPGRLLGRTLEPVIQALALPYRAHPDYRPEWTPNA